MIIIIINFFQFGFKNEKVKKWKSALTNSHQHSYKKKKIIEKI